MAKATVLMHVPARENGELFRSFFDLDFELAVSFCLYGSFQLPTKWILSNYRPLIILSGQYTAADASKHDAVM